MCKNKNKEKESYFVLFFCLSIHLNNKNTQIQYPIGHKKMRITFTNELCYLVMKIGDEDSCFCALSLEVPSRDDDPDMDRWVRVFDPDGAETFRLCYVFPDDRRAWLCYGYSCGSLHWWGKFREDQFTGLKKVRGSSRFKTVVTENGSEYLADVNGDEVLLCFTVRMRAPLSLGMNGYNLRVADDVDRRHWCEEGHYLGGFVHKTILEGEDTLRYILK